MNPMMPYGLGTSPYGMNPYTVNPYLALVQPPQPQQPGFSWDTLITGLMSYLQTQPQQQGAPPMPPAVIAQASTQPIQAADASQVSAAMGQAPVRAVQTVAPSFSASVADTSAPFRTPSGVAPPVLEQVH